MDHEAIQKYYEGHKPRFDYQKDLFDRMIPGPIGLVYDIGTFFPFSSVHIAEKYGAQVRFGCHKPCEDYSENIKAMIVDLCNPPVLEPADVVIMTEVFEHLPCDLFKVLDWAVSVVRPGGYLFLSFPTGDIGRNIPRGIDLFDEYPADGDHAHIREFSVGQARDFYNRTGFEVIEERCVKTPLYYGGEGILHVLLRKPI